jgi:formylmethanofuran dehydrogenase subunit E
MAKTKAHGLTCEKCGEICSMAHSVPKIGSETESLLVCQKCYDAATKNSAIYIRL